MFLNIDLIHISWVVYEIFITEFFNIIFLIFHVIILCSFFIHFIFTSLLWIAFLMSRSIKIFSFLLIGLYFCFFILLDLYWLCFHSSSGRGEHIIIISLRIAYIINVHNCRLWSYWPIQILIVLNFSLVITWWYWRL